MTPPQKAMLIQARDALLSACGGRCNAEYNPCECREVASELQAVIDAPDAEPVAWMDPWTQKRCVTDYEAYGTRGIPLYAYPPSRQPLTEAEIIKIAQDNLAAEPGCDGYDKRYGRVLVATENCIKPLYAAAGAAPVPTGWQIVPVEALTRWRDAFSEELSAWDIDPPLHHIQTSHDEISAILVAAPKDAP